uniref:Protein TIC 214 n=1 Tax=Hypseocharis bilobata TaxID=253189 RepID=V9P879_9ROSI|nr:hypothetical chloroplast RF19 [Hypseocharis bilobata]YP_008994542.1 hypothetical chloroplast RF19 [Hypseocharis bilobata]AGV02959.1 hypothetical chloroplast RF19 [Hypseocharis bilobata]AGV02971.1 hypothetical chloroplast RF19 [Hypseocharis bilobata]
MYRTKVYSLRAAVIFGLFYGSLVTFSKGTTYLFLLRPRILEKEEGRRQRVAIEAGFTLGHFVGFIIIFHAPLYKTLQSDYMKYFLTLYYCFYQFFEKNNLTKQTYFVPINSIHHLRREFLKSLSFRLLNYAFFPNGNLSKIIPMYLVRSDYKILFITSSCVGWLMGHILCMNLTGSLVKWLREKHAWKSFNRARMFIEYQIYQAQHRGLIRSIHLSITNAVVFLFWLRSSLMKNKMKLIRSLLIWVQQNFLWVQHKFLWIRKNYTILNIFYAIKYLRYLIPDTLRSVTKRKRFEFNYFEAQTVNFLLRLLTISIFISALYYSGRTWQPLFPFCRGPRSFYNYGLEEPLAALLGENEEALEEARSLGLTTKAKKKKYEKPEIKEEDDEPEVEDDEAWRESEELRKQREDEEFEAGLAQDLAEREKERGRAWVKENSKKAVLDELESIPFFKFFVQRHIRANRMIRPNRYIINHWEKNIVKKEMSQFFFFKCKSDGKERRSFTYLPALATFFEMIEKRVSFFLKEELSSDKFYELWVLRNEQKKEFLNEEFFTRVNNLKRKGNDPGHPSFYTCEQPQPPEFPSLEGLEKRTRLYKFKNTPENFQNVISVPGYVAIAEEIYSPEDHENDPFLNGPSRGSFYDKSEIEIYNQKRAASKSVDGVRAKLYRLVSLKVGRLFRDPKEIGKLIYARMKRACTLARPILIRVIVKSILNINMFMFGRRPSHNARVLYYWIFQAMEQHNMFISRYININNEVFKNIKNAVMDWMSGDIKPISDIKLMLKLLFIDIDETPMKKPKPKKGSYFARNRIFTRLLSLSTEYDKREQKLNIRNLFSQKEDIKLYKNKKKLYRKKKKRLSFLKTGSPRSLDSKDRREVYQFLVQATRYFPRDKKEYLTLLKTKYFNVDDLDFGMDLCEVSQKPFMGNIKKRYKICIQVATSKATIVKRVPQWNYYLAEADTRWFSRFLVKDNKWAPEPMSYRTKKAKFRGIPTRRHMQDDDYSMSLSFVLKQFRRPDFRRHILKGTVRTLRRKMTVCAGYQHRVLSPLFLPKRRKSTLLILSTLDIREVLKRFRRGLVYMWEPYGFFELHFISKQMNPVLQNLLRDPMCKKLRMDLIFSKGWIIKILRLMWESPDFLTENEGGAEKEKVNKKKETKTKEPESKKTESETEAHKAYQKASQRMNELLIRDARQIIISDLWGLFDVGHATRGCFLMAQAILRKKIIFPLAIIIKNIARTLLFKTPEWSQDFEALKRERYTLCHVSGIPPSGPFDSKFPEFWVTEGMQIRVEFPFNLPWCRSERAPEPEMEKTDSYLTIWGKISDMPFGDPISQHSFFQELIEFLETEVLANFQKKKKGFRRVLLFLKKKFFRSKLLKGSKVKKRKNSKEISQLIKPKKEKVSKVKKRKKGNEISELIKRKKETKRKMKDMMDKTHTIRNEIERITKETEKELLTFETTVSSNKTSFYWQTVESLIKILKILKRKKTRLIRKSYYFFQFLIETIYVNSINNFLEEVNKRINVLRVVALPKLTKKISKNIIKKIKKKYFILILENPSFLNFSSLSQAYVFYKLSQTQAINPYLRASLQYRGTSLFLKKKLKSYLEAYFFGQGLGHSEFKQNYGVEKPFFPYKVKDKSNPWKNWLRSHFQPYILSDLRWSRLEPQKWRNKMNQRRMVQSKDLKKQDSYQVDSIPSENSKFKKQYRYDLLAYNFLNDESKKDPYIEAPLLVNNKQAAVHSYNIHKHSLVNTITKNHTAFLEKGRLLNMHIDCNKKMKDVWAMTPVLSYRLLQFSSGNQMDKNAIDSWISNDHRSLGPYADDPMAAIAWESLKRSLYVCRPWAISWVLQPHSFFVKWPSLENLGYDREILSAPLTAKLAMSFHMNARCAEAILKPTWMALLYVDFFLTDSLNHINHYEKHLDKRRKPLDQKNNRIMEQRVKEDLEAQAEAIGTSIYEKIKRNSKETERNSKKTERNSKKTKKNFFDWMGFWRVLNNEDELRLYASRSNLERSNLESWLFPEFVRLYNLCNLYTMQPWTLKIDYLFQNLQIRLTADYDYLSLWSDYYSCPYYLSKQTEKKEKVSQPLSFARPTSSLKPKHSVEFLQHSFDDKTKEYLKATVKVLREEMARKEKEEKEKEEKEEKESREKEEVGGRKVKKKKETKKKTNIRLIEGHWTRALESLEDSYNFNVQLSSTFFSDYWIKYRLQLRSMRLIWLLKMHELPPNTTTMGVKQQGRLLNQVMLLMGQRKAEALGVEHASDPLCLTKTLPRLLSLGVFDLETVRIFKEINRKFLKYQILVIPAIHKQKFQNLEVKKIKLEQKTDKVIGKARNKVTQILMSLGSITDTNKNTNENPIVEEPAELTKKGLLAPEDVLSPRSRRKLRILMSLGSTLGSIIDTNKNTNENPIVEEPAELTKEEKEELNKTRNKLMKLRFFLWPNYRLEDLACMNRYWFNTNNGSRFSMLRIRMYPRLKTRK